MLSVANREQFHEGTNHLKQERKKKTKNEMEQLLLVHGLQGEGSPSVVNIGKSEVKQISQHKHTVPCIKFQPYVLHLCDGIVACTTCLGGCCWGDALCCQKGPVLGKVGEFQHSSPFPRAQDTAGLASRGATALSAQEPFLGWPFYRPFRAAASL